MKCEQSEHLANKGKTGLIRFGGYNEVIKFDLVKFSLQEIPSLVVFFQLLVGKCLPQLLLQLQLLQPEELCSTLVQVPPIL